MFLQVLLVEVVPPFCLHTPVGNLPVKRGTRVLFVAAVVRVFCQPGHGVTLPCFYPYEDRSALPQLSVQWRGPGNQLLCHYIKHKGFQRCSEGYHMTYRPGSITLTIQQVRLQDYGPHVCSVSKRDEFLDYNDTTATNELSHQGCNLF
uniref:Ig-like domain-containing protein n=1 Tax=Takifugu rubripes TaxID=31033 RepID=A0A674MJN4_TAKRU